MLNRTDRNRHGIALYLYNGNMLLVACFHNTGLKLGHFLSAAHHGNARIVDHADQVSAMLTNIEFVVITHDKIPPFDILQIHYIMLLSDFQVLTKK
jgi:hypothetical protein